MAEHDPTAPSDVTENRGGFDRSADAVSNFLAKPPFFVGCVVFIVGWAVAGPVADFSHGWVDVLQLVAAAITLLLVALLENEAWRANKATQRKLNAIAAGLAHLMERSGADPEHVRQLNAAVGLEKRESTTG